MATSSPEIIADKIKIVCDRHRVLRLRIFGSSANGTDRAESDVDLLVDYEAGCVPTFFAIAKLEEELSPIFTGRRIDLMRPDDLHWFIRRSILQSARTLYER